MSDIKLWAAVALILSLHVAYTDASTMKIEASPANIYPVLTKKLQIRCAVIAPVATTTVKPTTTPTTTKATTKAATTQTTTKAAITTAKPTSTTAKAFVTTTSATVTNQATNTTATTTQTTSTTTTTTTKPTTTQPKTTISQTSPTTVNPTTSTQADITYLLSIVISKQNSATGKTDTVASVAGRLAANAEVQYLGTVEVQGNTDNSTKSEQGFLQLTWNYPLEQHGGNYICTASGLNSAKQTVSLSTSVQIVVTQPNISDLVNYVSAHDKSLTDLQLQASQQSQSTQDMELDMEDLEANLTQETTELYEEAGGLRGRTVQSGSSSCSNNYVYFSTTFNEPPVVFLSVSSLNLYVASYWYGSTSSTWQTSIQYVTQSYFVFNCYGNNYLTVQNVDWVAMN